MGGTRTYLNYTGRVGTESVNGTSTAGRGARGVSQLLYCHNPWVGRCYDDALNPKRWQRGAFPLILNPRLAGALLQLAGGARTQRVPTSGLMAIAAALNLCANVSVFGFSDGATIAGATSTANNNNNSVKGVREAACARYFSCATSEAAYVKDSSASHDLAHQQRVLAMLERQHFIKRFASSAQKGRRRRRER